MKFYVLRLVDWLPNAVRVVREGQSFGAAFFENISVSGRVQIHRIIICPKLYNYIQGKSHKGYFRIYFVRNQKY
jgi:hypothetical protein